MKQLLKFLGFHIHDWNKWEPVSGGSIVHGNVTTGKFVTQHKVCKSCGYIKLKTETTY